MTNFFEGLWQLLAERERRNVKALITIFAIHFALLVAIEVAIQCWTKTIFHPANAYFGLGWMGTFLLGVWLRGGLPLDAILVGHAATDNPFARTVTRVMIGFYAVESFICICACIIPMYANPGACALLLLSSAAYFLYRIMAGLTIDWGKWAYFPLANIGISVAVLVFSAWVKAYLPTEMDMDYGTEMLLGLILFVVSFLIRQKDQRTAPAAQAETNHGGGHAH